MRDDWKIYERGGAIFGSLEPHMAGFFIKPPKGREYYYTDRALAGFKGEHLYWCYGQPEYRKRSLRWIERWITQGAKGNFVNTAKRRYQTCMKFLAPLINTPLSKEKVVSLKHLNEVNKCLLLHTRTLAMSIDAFDDYFEEVFANRLKKAGYGRVCENKELWSQLIQPSYRSMPMNYKLALLELSRKAKRLGVIMRKDEIRKIWSRYFWLTMGWSGTLPLRLQNIKRKVQKQMKLSRPEYNNERAALLNYPGQISRAREKIIKQFKIPKKTINPFFQILDSFARLHDERKEIQMRTLYAINEARKAAAKQYQTPLKDAQMMKISELRSFLCTGKFSRKRIQKRRIGYYALFDHGRTVFETEGKAAIVLLDKEMAVSDSDRREINGTIASPGRSIGRAIVTDNPREAIRLVKNGDILITSMTTPDFIPAMKKAAGVVTNEGGVTAHAAIVSRELGIPCITGAAYATHIFKTGDLVEVDAGKGVVRKFSRK